MPLVWGGFCAPGSDYIVFPQDSYPSLHNPLPRRQPGIEHHAPECPGRKDSQVASGKATPPRAVASNPYKREWQPRSPYREAIKGAERKAEGLLFFCR